MGKIIMLKELMVDVEEPVIVGSGLKKRDIFLRDSTGTARLAVWEIEVGKAEEDRSYRFWVPLLSQVTFITLVNSWLGSKVTVQMYLLFTPCFISLS